jgi:hypothetical protein
MAHVITEVVTFTPTVTVPDGGDSRVNAAEVVAAIAQALANRSRSLKAVTDVAAVKNAPNTFTALNTFGAGLTVSAGVLTASAGLIASHVVTATVTASASGSFGGALTVTGNVTSGGAVQGATLVSTAGLTVGNGATVTAGGLTVAAGGVSVTTGNATVVAGNVRLADNTRIVEYINPSFVERAMPLGEAMPHDAALTELLGDYWEQTGGGVGTLDFPIRTPDGAVLAQARMIAFAPASANALSLFGRTIDWNTTPQAGPSFGGNIVTQAGITHATLATITTLTIPSVSVSNDTEEFLLRVLLGATGNRLFALRLTYADPGLTNR